MKTMYQIKLSLLKDNVEVDYITRDIATYEEYNYPKGMLINLHLLINRNNIVEEFDWIVDQIRNMFL